MPTNDLMEKIVSLCKRRGFVFPGSEIYGGLQNSWDYGPLGVELKNNIKNLWWKRFVQSREDVVGIDAALIMNPKVWEASGHLSAGFADVLIECKNCHKRFRIDEYENEGMKVHTNESIPGLSNKSYILGISGSNTIACKNCGTKGSLDHPRKFNLMFKTFVGSTEEASSIAYFRPETAQAMFVDFKNVLDTMRKTLPFGIAQIGKAFRNEITPGNFIFRTREFEQMEIEYFIRSTEWEKHFEYWKGEMIQWMKDIGLDMKKVHEFEQPEGERAHYSKRTLDFEYEFPFGQKELYGLAYRGDFDLKNHYKEAPYKEEEGEAFYPHVIEPTWGVDRTVLAVLSSAYDDSDPEHIILRLSPKLAPYKAAVFPLLKNKSELVKKAREVYNMLVHSTSSGHAISAIAPIAWDDRGNIGKRYYSQDEIGTPFCITVDFDTLGEEKRGSLSAEGGSSSGGKDTVTVRDRDTGKQERVKIEKLNVFLRDGMR
jgi:glycyl-tRNA synthetase